LLTPFLLCWHCTRRIHAISTVPDTPSGVWREDALLSLEERGLPFLRWLIQQGWANEQDVSDAALEEYLYSTDDDEMSIEKGKHL
jgi:hypothetical protein